jgi:hypothetical protein
VNNGTDREYKSCDVFVKVPCASLSLPLLPLSNNMIASLLYRMLLMEDIGSKALGKDSKIRVLGSVYIAVKCAIIHSGTRLT